MNALIKYYMYVHTTDGILVTTSSVRVDLLVELMYFQAFFAWSRALSVTSALTVTPKMSSWKRFDS